MSAKVLLKDIVDALEMQFDEQSSFLDLDTGQVVVVSSDLLSQAENSEENEEPEMPEWQIGEWEICKKIVTTDHFVRLPDQFDVHEWGIMEQFTESLESVKVRDDLSYAIHGSGAFRHFRREIERHHIEQDWYRFRKEALRQIAIEWCKENGIDYAES